MSEVSQRDDVTFDTLFKSYLRSCIREELAALKFTHREAPPEDKLLTAEEAAAILKVSESWLYMHASKLPYAVRLSSTVIRFSSRKIQAEIQRKLKMQARQ